MLRAILILILVVASNDWLNGQAIDWSISDSQERNFPVGETQTWTDHAYQPNARSAVQFFMGIEGSKQPQDFGVNANFGGRVSANWSRVVLPELGIGLQAGTALVASDNAVQVFERVAGDSSRLQSFTTLGVFHEGISGLKVGAVYDYLYQDSFDRFSLGQVRSMVGLELSDRWELGVRSAIPVHDQAGRFGNIDLRLRSLAQGSLYARRTFDGGSQVGAWMGISEGHAEANLALGDLPRTGSRFLWGAEFLTPLTDRLAIFAQANFITPADTGTVDAFLGLQYSLGHPGSTIRRHSLPLLPVAGSPTFSVDLIR